MTDKQRVAAWIEAATEQRDRCVASAVLLTAHIAAATALLEHNERQPAEATAP